MAETTAPPDPSQDARREAETRSPPDPPAEACRTVPIRPIDAAWEHPPHPHQLGAYRILGVLGEGGMGVVYEAEQQQPRRPVALKIIRPLFVSREVLRRFMLEAEVLGKLEHPGIARVYEAGTADTGHGPQPFFAMELVRGVPLTRYVREREFRTRQRLELLAKVCDAVQYAHQRGVVHRDLKPANILVTDEGQPKVLDFGVARATDADVHAATLQTDVGQLVGTLPYMSPEQASGDPGQLDTRSDVYALGVIAYEALAGRLPHDLTGKLLPEAVQIIREAEPSRFSSVHTAYRGDVETIVGKAMEKDRERRYAGAAEMAADLRRYLDDEPIAARAPSAWYLYSKLAARHKGLIWSLAAWATVIVVLMLLSAHAFYASGASLRRQVRASSEATAAVVAELVGDHFEESELLASVVATLPGMIEAVQRRDVPAVSGVLRAVVEAHPTVQRAYLLDAHGILWTDYPHNVGSLGSVMRPYVALAEARRPAVSDVFQNDDWPPAPAVAVGSPVVDGRNGIIGVVAFQFRLQDLMDWLKRADGPRRDARGGDPADGRELFILDHIGTVAAHPRFDFAKTPSYDREYRKYAALEQVRDAVRGAGSVADYKDPVSGQEMVAAFRPVKMRGGGNWVVVAQQPVAEAYAPIGRLGTQIAVATVTLAVLISSGALLTFARSLARRRARR